MKVLLIMKGKITMSKKYDSSKYYIDFSGSENLTENEKEDLEEIQQTLRPVERVDQLFDYRNNGKITDDEFEQMTGVPLS